MAFEIKLFLLLTVVQVSYGKLPLEDATATVDQLFSYRIDPNDFTGQEIMVKEAGKDVLPSWLEFDRSSSQLLGVPTSKDKGTYIISIDQELFAVTVVEPTKYQLAQPTHVDEQTVCKARDSITVVYLRLNADITPMLPLEKAKLVRSLTAHLSLQPDHISMSSKPADLVDSSHALISGPGDVSSGDSMSVLSWVVGCGAAKAHHMDILEKLESTAKDGSMGKALDTGVSGWQVQSNQPKVLSKRRLRRQALVTATPSPSSSTTTVAASTTTESTEPVPTAVVTTTKMTTVYVKPTNKAPELNTALLPSSIPANGGELVRWKIPDGLFVDPEGEVVSYSVESNSGTKEWITNQLDGEWELIGLAAEALEEQQETLQLHAMDPSGDTTTTTLNIMHGQSNKNYITQRYTLRIREDITSQAASIVLLAQTLEEVASFKSIVMQVLTDEMPGTIVIIGDNMGYQDSCPMKENMQSKNALTALVGQNLALVGNDEDQLYISELTSIQPLPPCHGAKPVVNEQRFAQYAHLNITLGELYESIVPIDTFTDEEDGDLSKLLSNLMVDGIHESDSWISYDTSSRRLQAFTWDVPESEPQLLFEVKDSDNKMVEKEIKISFIDNFDLMLPTNLVTLTISTKYSIFANSHKSQVDLYRKISSAFQGSVVTFKLVKQGSVVVVFSLREVSSTPPVSCNVERMESYKDTLFDGDSISESFAKQLDSYPLTQVDFAPAGSCENEVSPKSATGAVYYPVMTEEPTTESNSLIIIIIIVIVVIIVIIIVVVVICVRKQKAKKNKRPQAYDSVIEKRVPVILDEEEMKSLNEPLVPAANVSYKPTPTPPAYPGDDHYHPDTPPVSEPDDEQRILDRSP